MINRRTLLGSGVAAPWILSHGIAGAASRPRVGLTLPLTGVQASVAEELLAGYQLAFHDARISGLDVDLVVEDDHSAVKKTVAAVQKFGRDPSFVALSGVVGTPHAKEAIPEARQTQIPVIGIRSGASELRDGGPFVYHLRASYEAEISRMVEMLKDTSDKVSVVYSKDAFGNGAMEHLRKVTAARGVSIVKAVGAERDGSNIDVAVKLAVAPQLQSKALIILMITRPTVAALRIARDTAFLGPTFAMSFTASGELTSAHPDLVRGLGLVTAFPLPRTAPDDTSVAFRRAIKVVGKANLASSVTAYEGYAYGTTITQALQRVEGRLTRESLMRAMVTPPALAVGGERLQFDRQLVGRQYLKVVYFDRQGILRG